jgi:RHS repeat-associated protein
MKLSFRYFALTILLAFVFPRHGGAQQVAGNTSPNGNAGDYNGSVTTAGSYDPFTGNANRVIEDIVVPGSVGAYPLAWTRRLNTRAPASLSPSKLGNAGGWSHSYDWQLVVNHPVEPTPPPLGWPDDPRPHATLTYPDGRSVVWGAEPGDDTFYRPGSIGSADSGPFGMRDRFINHHDGVNYELLMADGGVVKFYKPNPSSTACIATEIVDPYGQVTTLHYVSGQLDKITEPSGRYLKISYHPPPLPGGLVSSVEANDGLGHVTQTVLYHYDEYTFYPLHPANYLTRVDYVEEGTNATYTYQASNRPPIPTPQQDPNGVVYGLVSTCQDVRFAGPMKSIMYEYRTPSPGPSGEVGWGQILREKNISGLVLSEVEYQPYVLGQPFDLWRKEHRPGNVVREFRYNPSGNPNQPYVSELSDFLGHWTLFELVHNIGDGTDHFLITDARNKTTDKQTEPFFNATVRVTHPPPDSSYEETIYTDPARPHYVASHRDENGHTTIYTRNINTHEVERMDYPDGGWESFTYNPFKQIEDHTMTSGGVEHFQYDTRGLKIRYWPPPTPSDTVPCQHKTQYVYYDANSSPGHFDRIDRLWKVIDPEGHTTTYDYNPRGQITRVTHDDGTFTQSEYNKEDGTLTWTADENHPNAWMGGHVYERTQYSYDMYNRVTDVINPLGETTSYDYTPRNGLLALSHTTSSVYRVTTPGSPTSAPRLTEYDYDSNFRRITMIQAPGIPDQATTTYHYDAVGNLEWVLDPRTFQTTYGYDERNRQTSIRNDSLNETTDILYDYVGNKLRETRPDTAVRTWDYDAMNRLSHFYDWRLSPTPLQVEAAAATYGRDLAGNALTITDRKGASYVYEYDKLNRKVSLTNPPDAHNVSRTETWLYDIAGNLYRYKNPAGDIKESHYDTRNRQDRCSWIGNVGPDIVTRYDAASRVTAVLANSGVQAAMRGGTAPDDVIYAETKVAFGYDDANRKIWEDQILDGQTPRRIQTDINPDGTRRNLQITSPDPVVQADPLTVTEMPGGGPYFIEYHYTGRNQLASIAGGDWSFTYSYDFSGNMTERLAEYNNRSSSTSCPTAYYDARNRPTLWQQTSNGQIFAASHYQYDSAGREEATWREEQNNLGERFSYSATNQLTNVAYNASNVSGGNPSNATRTVTYQYTDKLNRTSVTDTPQSGTPVVTSYAAGALNQYGSVGGVNYSYDNNFNLTGTIGLSVSYDAANQVVSATGHHPYTGDNHVAYVYDGLGRCVKQTIDNVATILVYDGWQAIAEFDGWNYFQAWNVYGSGADEILLRYNSQAKYGYMRFHQDRHGNAVFLIDNDGQGIEKYTYDAFGRPAITDWFGNPHLYSYYGHRFLFQGRDYFHELGVYDYRHRFYHPEVGRFLQTDPTGFDGGDMNLFRYCGDDPVDISDPTGLEGEEYGLNHLEAARSTARHQVESAVSDPNRQATFGTIRQTGGHLKTIKYYPSKMVPVYKYGNKYIVGGTVDGRAVTQSGVSWELEMSDKAPPKGYRTVYNAHSHNDKLAGTKTNGIASPRWSNYDEALPNVDRMDESSGKWYYRRGGQEVSAEKAARYGAGNDRSQNGPTGSAVNTESTAPSAKDVDLAHQATGVPSLGAEAVNFAPGKP